MYFEDYNKRNARENQTGFGHICNGGGATIKDSPINIHIHIHAGDEPTVNKITRSLYAIFGQRHKTIENAASISDDDIQGSVIRAIENR